VPIWTTISVVPVIVFELATAEPASTYVVVMQGNVSAYFEAVKLLICRSSPIRPYQLLLPSLKAKSIKLVDDAVRHDRTLMH